MIANKNELNRQLWLSNVLSKLPEGLSILDIGAGELKNKHHCGHLRYTSQDFCQHVGARDGYEVGLQTPSWDTSRIDLVSDIIAIPVEDCSFDVVLCSEVLEHVPDPINALREMSRVLKPDGLAIITAPFVSNVHMAPHYFYSGFSKYWYTHHLPIFGFEIQELTANGDWFDVLAQEARRLGGMERRGNVFIWPLAYLASMCIFNYLKWRHPKNASDLACFGWHCMARKVKIA